MPTQSKEATYLLHLIDVMRKKSNNLDLLTAYTSGAAHGHLRVIRIVLDDVARLVREDPFSNINMAQFGFDALQLRPLPSGRLRSGRARSVGSRSAGRKSKDPAP